MSIEDEVFKLVDMSYEISNVKGEWIVPANPKYYDIMGTFDNTDTIIWKQAKNVIKGDIIYLYITVPYSSIMFKCEVVETNIPYKYKDEKFTINEVMKIKLSKRYKKDQFNLNTLNECKVKSVRSLRRITKELSKKLNKDN